MIQRYYNVPYPYLYLCFKLQEVDGNPNQHSSPYKDLNGIVSNTSLVVDTLPGVNSVNENLDDIKSDTFEVVSYCIEEIIDAVQENSAVTVAVNEAINAVDDEETKNESSSDSAVFVSDGIQTSGNTSKLKYILGPEYETYILEDEGKSSAVKDIFGEKQLKNCETKKSWTGTNNIDRGINEIDTNGNKFKCNEVIIFSKDSEDLSVRLLSISKNISPTSQNNEGENYFSNIENTTVNQNKNIKMKKLKRNAGGGSRFRLGALFGIGNTNISTDVSPKEPTVATNPRYSSLDLCDSSYSSLEIERQNGQVSTEPFSNSPPKYHKSTTSLVKRSASKLSLGGVGNAYSCSQARSQHVKNQHNSSYQTLPVPDGSNTAIDATPVLLAVRKRASSDSKPGIFSYGNSSNDDSNYYSSNSSKNCSPSVNPKNKNGNPTHTKQSSDYRHPTTTTTSNSTKLGFLKIFNKSLHALHPSSQHSSNHNHQPDNGREKQKDATQIPVKQHYSHKGVYNTLQHQKHRGGNRVHQVNNIVNSNSPNSRRTHTLPAEVLSVRPLHASDLKHAESITTSAQVPRPVLPQKRITSNTSATFNAREHLMFMLRRRRRGGKFTPNTNNDYEDIEVGKLNGGNLGISPIMNASTSEQTSSSMSSINSTQDRRRGNSRYQHSNVPNTLNGQKLTIRPQVHHSHSLNSNTRHLPVHSSSSTNSVNSTTSSTERNSGNFYRLK